MKIAHVTQEGPLCNPEFETFRKDHSRTVLTRNLTKIFADESQNSKGPDHLQAASCPRKFSDLEPKESIWYM
jgi:hypothetical protein